MPIQYKLWYFNMMGRAELIRLIFAEAGVDYEDCRFPQEQWPSLKQREFDDRLPYITLKTSEMPNGQVPVLEMDGKKLTGSIAIARYLANEYGLAGRTNLEKQHADATIDALADVFNALAPILFTQDPAKKKAALENFKVEKLEPFLVRASRVLIKNGSGYFVGKDLTYADLAVFQSLGFMLQSHPECFVSHPKLIEFIGRIGSRDRINSWVDRRPKTGM